MAATPCIASPCWSADVVGRFRVLRPAAAALMLTVAVSGGSRSQPAPFNPREESVETLPAGPGREETFYLCTACHAYRLVSNQGMTREKWDETLSWMTERHNMPDVQGADRDLILAYLAEHHPPKPAPGRGAGGFRNPFAPE
jgi:hypothetical protein